MTRFLQAGRMAALAVVALATPALAQTVIVNPGAEPPPPPPSTVIITEPAPQPTVECEKSTTTKDQLIGSKTETSTNCTTRVPVQGQY